MAIVYQTVNKINGKSYIGVDSNNNPKYMGSGVLIKSAIKKHGKSNFEKKIIREFDNVDSAFKYERDLIKKVNAVESDEYYNLAEGGHGGYTGPGNTNFKHTEETKQKIRESHLGKKFTKEHKKKIGDIHRGKVVSDETKLKMSKSKTGKTHSLEAKLKMSKSRREQMRNARNVVINGITYNSVASAARELGLNRTTLSSRLKSNTFKEYYYG